MLVDLLTSTLYATFQAFERLEFVPVALITERFFTAAVGIVLLLAGAGVVAVSAVFLGGALLRVRRSPRACSSGTSCAPGSCSPRPWPAR